MSWLTSLLNGDKKVWAKIRKAGYRTARAYLAKQVGYSDVQAVVLDKVADLTLDDLSGLLRKLDRLKQELPQQYRGKVDEVLADFLRP